MKRARRATEDDGADILPARRKYEQGRPWGLIVVLIGLALVVIVTCGLVWLYIGTDQLARNNARHDIESYRQSCSTADKSWQTIDLDQAVFDDPVEIDGRTMVAIMSIPSIDQHWPIWADKSAVDRGVIWYDNTASFGELGNSVVSAYRITYGSPFGALADMGEKTVLIVETCHMRYHYEIVTPIGDITVKSDDRSVLEAVLHDPGRRPTGRMMTLITSQDKLPSDQRAVGLAALVLAESR